MITGLIGLLFIAFIWGLAMQPASSGFGCSSTPSQTKASTASRNSSG